MARRRVLTSFAVTLGILSLLVGFSLRRAGAQAQTSGDDTTLVAYLPVASLASKEVATVHVVNVGRDLTAPPEKFSIVFADVRNAMLIPEQRCEVATGQTCSVSLLAKDCPARARGGVCEFRAIVIGEPMPCVTPGMSVGDWMANVELFSGAGPSKFVAGDNRVLTLPSDGCGGGVDTPSPDVPGIDEVVPPPDVPGIDEVTSPDVPGIDAFVPPPDVPGVDAFVPPPDVPGVDAFVPPPDVPSVDAFVPPPDLPGVDAFVPPPDVPTVDAFVPPPDAPGIDSFSAPLRSTLRR
ncbi:MAG TPA: hypothetical protein VM032_08725 [Vicinamibacterales bacterium]|nr:hypothetical protein [Vicinamibacterales bacterium]